ncbi:MAG TPA: cation transporter [Saprospiraceae bacterium]|nr:cation transporter [Saprospiraceae bacterium]
MPAFVLNSVFALTEIAGGILTKSVSILADALHDLGDSFALGTAWYFERISRRGRDSQHSHGYRRYSVVGKAMAELARLKKTIRRQLNTLHIKHATIEFEYPDKPLPNAQSSFSSDLQSVIGLPSTSIWTID